MAQKDGYRRLHTEAYRGGHTREAEQPPPPTSPKAPQVTAKGDVPDQDVYENSSHDPPPSAPPLLSDMDYLEGYENTQFQNIFVPPPPYEPRDTRQNQPRRVEADLPNISEHRARQALVKEVGKNCCSGKTAANEMVFTSLLPSNAFHYQLNTFTEGRKTAWAYLPFKGQRIDGPKNGVPPGPWNVNIRPREMFKDHEKHVEVPHTASVKACHGCMGNGKDTCWKCLGRGQVICATCDGTGYRMEPQIRHDRHGHHQDHYGNQHHQGDDHVVYESVPCSACRRSGRKRCSVCSGCGQTKCSVCEGKKKLKCYIELTVTWRNNRMDHVVKNVSLPDNLIEEALGRKAFEETQSRVLPVNIFSDNAVYRASQQLVDSHAVSFPKERILSQRHWIRIVPVTEAQCDFKGKNFSYFVYGNDDNVHAPNYPEKGCSIL